MPKIKSQDKWRTSQVTEHYTRKQRRYQITKTKMYEMNIIIDCSNVEYSQKLKIYSSRPGRVIEVIVL